jgi:signal transduction histidine kinase
MNERPSIPTDVTSGTTSTDPPLRVEETQGAVLRPGQEIVAMIVHELRGPLATMSNTLESCRADPNQAAPSPAKEILARQVRKALRLVNDLLDVSRLTHGAPNVLAEPVNISQVITSTVQDLDHEIRKRQQVLILDMAPETVWVLGDAMRLGQIVANLLENGSKYSGMGGKIKLSLTREDIQVVLCVRDDGAGIAPEDLPHVFDPYFRGKHSLEHGESGLGLGLTLVRRLVELHGGSIEARSGGAGCGSEFTLRLPALAEP